MLAPTPRTALVPVPAFALGNAIARRERSQYARAGLLREVWVQRSPESRNFDAS